MSFIRVILAFVFPPLAVIDRGFGSLLLVTILTVLGFVPGILAALIIVGNEKPKYVAPKEPTFYEKTQKWSKQIEAWGERKKAEREARQQDK